MVLARRRKKHQAFCPCTRSLTSFWYSPIRLVACLRISLGWGCVCWQWIWFLAVHIAHTVIGAHISNSFPDNLSIIYLVRRKKLAFEELVFWILPLTSAHTLRARGHSHKMCLVDVGVYALKSNLLACYK